MRASARLPLIRRREVFDAASDLYYYYWCHEHDEQTVIPARLIFSRDEKTYQVIDADGRWRGKIAWTVKELQDKLRAGRQDS